MFSLFFFFIVLVDTFYQKVLYNSCLLLFFCVMKFRKQNNIFCTSKASLWFNQKNNFCIMNKIKLIWFYSLYRNYFFNKNVIFLHILKIIFTMLRLKIFLEYWIILCISRKLLCVKGSLHTTIFWIYTELFNILKLFLSLT